MIRLTIATSCILVLLQIIVSPSFGQHADSSLVFAPGSVHSELHLGKEEPTIGGILSVALGSYNAFGEDGTYRTFLQPNFGFDFLAEPSPGLHFLFGGRLGIPAPINTEILFGMRFPLHDNSDNSVRVFADAALLFVDDSHDTIGPRIGIRGAFGARMIGAIDLEYRLAAEFRGTAMTVADLGRTRPLWWVGAEIGIAFPLVHSKPSLSRKDSLRASLQYITTTDELEELESTSSNIQLDIWLERFWKKRDMTPNTYLNEARIEFERRANQANEMFSSPRRLGVQTDPGRVAVIYGHPDDVEGATGSSNENHQYFMWIYHNRIQLQPLAVFLFETDHPFEWRQVYSNVPGEKSGILPAGLPPQMTRWIQ